MADLHDAELLKGNYVQHAYPWHTHDELCLGLVISGAIHLRTRTQEGTARAGSFVLVNSDELHQGSPAAPEGWRCRTLHLRPQVIEALVEELRPAGGSPGIWFNGPTFEDVFSATALLQLHKRSEAAGSSLDRQSRITLLIGRLLSFHRSWSSLRGAGMNEPQAVSNARLYLDEHLSDKVTLQELSAVSGLTPFRLLRAFTKSVGLTPHNYQVQARIRRAHNLLKVGEPIADVALAVGFADQAHFTRVYKAIMGGTPGQFRSANHLP
jgi:AraC-like DNA-binding protein